MDLALTSFCCPSPAAFFQDCISEQDLDEMNIEIIRNTLYKVCPTGGVGRFTWGAGLGHICSELPSGP